MLSDEVLHHIAAEVSRIQHSFTQTLTSEQMYLQLQRTDVAEEIRDLCQSARPQQPLPATPFNPSSIVKRPQALECDVMQFQNNKDKWIAFVGLMNGRPYEIFTGLADDEYGIMLPKSVTHGKIIRETNEDGTHRYDFQFVNTRGFKITAEGLSYKFDKEYWNYARLISGILRYGMPIEQVVHIVSSLQIDNESIASWTVGVCRALKRYLPDAEAEKGE